MEMPLSTLGNNSRCRIYRSTPAAFFLLCLGCLNYCSPDTAVPDKTLPSATQTIQESETSDSSVTLDIETARLIRQLAREYIKQIEVDFSDLGGKISTLQTAVNRLLGSPSADLLRVTQENWLEAHLSFQQNRVNLEFLSAIANDAQKAQLAKLVYQIDQWPILAGYIDTVAGYPRGGIVHDVNVELTAESLIQQHGLFDTTEATLGFHVLEFLLWGEPNAVSPQGRNEVFEPLSQLSEIQQESGMTVDQLGNNRRRALLGLVSSILVEDFQAAAAMQVQASTTFINSIEDRNSTVILNALLDSVTSVLNEEILARSLYKLLNDDLENALPSPYSQTSEMVVARQLQSVEKLVLETPTPEGVTLDQILVGLSPNFEEFFYQNLDASKACLVLLYGSISKPDQTLEASSVEFEVVECINLLTNLVDQFEQIKLSLPVVTSSI